MGIGHELLEYLHGRKAIRLPLCERLGADPERIHAYYLCALQTLPSILRDGIKCRNMVTTHRDLSSHALQSRRSTAWLGRSAALGYVDWVKEAPVHNCINLFWNPVNRTFKAFQRNALLSAPAGTLVEREVCILEVDAERILGDGNLHWCASAANLAGGGFTNCRMDALRKFHWNEIFTVDQTYDNSNRQASELLLCDEWAALEPSQPLAPEYIERVLIRSGSAQLVSEHLVSFPDLQLAEVDVFTTPSSLVEFEGRLVWTLRELEVTGAISVEDFVRNFERLLRFEEVIIGDLASLYDDQRVAVGWHGCGHTARVMLWAGLLASIASPNDVLLHAAVITAAMLHDTARPGDGEDAEHGDRAVARHQTLIHKLISDERDRTRCEYAIRLHCRDDNELVGTDLRQVMIWRILKDADAIERGRFAPPTYEKGCDQRQLRSEYLRLDADRRIEWAAYRLAGTVRTRNVTWGQYPLRTLLRCICDGLRVGIEVDLNSSADREYARQLLARLASLI